MHKLIIWGWLSLLFLGCGNSTQEEENLFPVQERLLTQLRQTCAKGLGYEKSVLNLQDSSDSELQEMFLTDSVCTLVSDLAQVLKPCLEDPQLLPYLEIETHKDTLIARVKEDSQRRQALQWQKILKTNDGQNLAYVETLIWKRSWLYENRVHFKVYLSPDGYYDHHDLEAFMQVSWLGQKFHARISGKIASP